MAASPQDARWHAEAVRSTGVTVLSGLLPVQLIDTLAATFQPLLQSAIRRKGAHGNRGQARYYTTLPFVAPWTNPLLIAHPEVVAVVDNLLGPDAVMSQLACDTPVAGSQFQALHRDAGDLFLGSAEPTPPYLLAVNIPLVDVSAANGPMEVVDGSHRLSDAEAVALIKDGSRAPRRVLMARGDVMIRDVRHIHRGTPNQTAMPRPMMVIGFQRPWFFRPDVRIRIPQGSWDGLPEAIKRRLRFNPVFADGEGLLEEEQTIMPPALRGAT